MFLSHVVGVAFWRKHSAKMTISEMVTVPNKAFALLLLENYWDTWSTKNLEAYQKEATYDERTIKKKRTATWEKYTTNAWRSKIFGGWSGLAWFKELFLSVRQDREKLCASIVEERYKLYCSATKI